MNITFRTLAICGRYLEQIYYHDRGIRYGEKNLLFKKNISPKKGINKQEEIRIDSLYRTKKTFKRLIWSNEGFLKTFITLTFRDDKIKDLDIANKHFQNFMKKMNYRYKDFLYIGVPEYQKRGVVHYHILTNIEYLPNEELAAIWSFGFVNIKSTNGIKDLAKYMTKYLTKNYANKDQRFFNKKKIFYSKNVKRPQILYSWDEIENFLKFFTIPEHLIYTKPIEATYIGRMTYELYKMDVDYFGPPTPEEEYKHLFKNVLE